MTGLFRFTVTNRADDKTRWTLASNTPDKFIENMAAMGHRVGGKDGTGIIGAVFKPHSKLEQSNLVEATAVILDVDGKFSVGPEGPPPNAILSENKKYYYAVVPPDWFLSKLPYRGVAHSSHSSHPTLPKYRVILPLAEPVAPSEFLRLWFWVYQMTERKADPACKNPDRMFFLPRATAEAKEAGWTWTRQLYGPLLSLRDVPDTFQIPPEFAYALARPRRRQGAHGADASTQYRPTDAFKLLDAFLELPLVAWAMQEAEAVTREVWRGLATNIAAIVMDDDDAIELGAKAFHEISECDDNRYNYGVTEKTFRDALKSARQYGPMTYATMKLNGLPDDVAEDHESVDADRRAKSPTAHARHVLSYQERTHRPKDLAPASTLRIPGADGTDASDATGAPEAPTAHATSTPALVPAEVLEPASSDAAVASSDPQPGDEPPKDGNALPELADFSQNDLLYDEQRAVYICRRTHHFTGEYYWDVDNPIKEQALDRRLLSLGLQRRALDDWKQHIPVFQVKAPLYHEQRLLVVSGTTTIFNTYRPSTLQPVPGDWSHIRALFLHLVGNDPDALEYVLDWFAAPLQRIRRRANPAAEPYKMGTALVFRGDPGGGKGTAMEIISLCYGMHNTLRLGQDDLDSRFNAYLQDKLFVIGNEVMSSSNRSTHTANKLKAWITEPTIFLEGKFSSGRELDNNFNLVLTSNDERPVMVERNDRRYSIFASTAVPPHIINPIRVDLVTSQQEVRAFYDHLLQRQIKIKYGQRYQTEAGDAVILASLSSSEAFARAIAEDGFMSIAASWVEAAKNGEIREPCVPSRDQQIILSDTMMSVYRHYCATTGSFPQHVRSLTHALRTYFPDASSSVIVQYAGTRRRGWSGIPMTVDDPALPASTAQSPMLVPPALTPSTPEATTDNLEG